MWSGMWDSWLVHVMWKPKYGGYSDEGIGRNLLLLIEGMESIHYETCYERLKECVKGFLSLSVFGSTFLFILKQSVQFFFSLLAKDAGVWKLRTTPSVKLCLLHRWWCSFRFSFLPFWIQIGFHSNLVKDTQDVQRSTEYVRERSESYNQFPELHITRRLTLCTLFCVSISQSLFLIDVHIYTSTTLCVATDHRMAATTILWERTPSISKPPS